MSLLTAILYALLGLFAVGWYAGFVQGDFSLLLLVLVVVTGAYWLADKLVFAPRRRLAARQLDGHAELVQQVLREQGLEDADAGLEQARQRVLAQPWWLDWTAGLFPVIALVFVLRSFLFEPFKIPSGSMIPTLLVGDLILVNKYEYGVRLPVVNHKVLPLGEPQRGDVAVFRYPQEPAVDYIKRIVGLPGDEVVYTADKRLRINGEQVPLSPLPDFYDDTTLRYHKQYTETLGDVPHRILVDESRASLMMPGNFPNRDQCSYSAQEMRCQVPAGHYFVMGDNRDNSLDSRFWGFVPDDHLKGRAFFVWMNFSNPGRIGSFD